MGTSDEEGNNSIDPTAGGLVWVRRRNGSWWPGRILGLDELPEGCLPTPRSGAPVKLLGRDDASVDWYNLEKSKRVKAFRCGEYDACIEKAKASASNLSRKAVKYARREDAIIHALELESALLGKDNPYLSVGPDTQDEKQLQVNEPPSSFHPIKESEENDKELSSSEGGSDSAPELSQSGVSFEEPDHVDAIKEGSKRRRTPNDSEDDGKEGIKRMRGLEDLGMGVASSLRRQRPQVAHVHEFLKRKNRRRTLSKVLECTPMVPVPVVCEQLSSPNGSSVHGASESKLSGLESKESKINSSPVINNNSDSTGVSCENTISLNTSAHVDASIGSKAKENEISSMPEVADNGSSGRLFDVPLAAEEKHSTGVSIIASDASQKTQVGAGAQSSQSSHVETLSLENEEHNETGSTSSGTADLNNLTQRIEKDTSKWQLKGKRNSRPRKVDIDDEAETHTAPIDRDSSLAGSSQNMDSNRVGGSLLPRGSSYHAKSRPVTETQVEEFRGWSWNAPHKESHHAKGSTAEMAPPQRLLPYRQSRFTVNPKYDTSDFSLRHHTVSSGLYDVTVEVQSSYRPQGVPYISLMSKSKGQPIVGHPISIEVLDDGFCNDLLSFSESYSSNSELHQNLNNNNNVSSTRRGGKNNMARHKGGRPPRKNRSLTKSKRNGLLSKKIRKLSSLTGSQKQSQLEKKLFGEKSKVPSIACVPLKVVFSRINAALNSSMRPAPCSAAAGL